MSHEDLDPTTPVVVGAAEIVHRDGPDFVPSSATALMLEAVHAALGPTGASDALGTATGAVFVPHGTWSESDPGRAIANSLGARARSIRSELGVLQHTLLQRAARQLSEEVQRRALRLATLLEPLLIVAMGGMVMLIVLAVLLPIIELNQLAR